MCYLETWGYCPNECDPSDAPTDDIDDEEDGRYQPKAEDEDRDEWRCGRNLQSGIIIAGVETKRGELPFLANIQTKEYIGTDFWGCGGSLINR